MPAFVFGDVHGRLDLLTMLIAKVRATLGNNVSLYSVGDLVDRGPESKGVINYCVENGVKAVLGNHETWLHQYLAMGKFDPFALHKVMGGSATLQSYGCHSTNVSQISRKLKHLIPPEHKQFILNMPLWRRVGTKGQVFFLSHTAVKRETYLSAVRECEGSPTDEDVMEHIATHNPVDILWTSNSFMNPNFHHFGSGCQVFGHSPTPEGRPIITKHWIAVDSGCEVRRPVLSGVVLGTDLAISVNGLTNTISESKGFTDFDLKGTNKR